jgi:hypothetical protein
MICHFKDEKQYKNAFILTFIGKLASIHDLFSLVEQLDHNKKFVLILK